jgi:hypothetical protein
MWGVGSFPYQAAGWWQLGSRRSRSPTSARRCGASCLRSSAHAAQGHVVARSARFTTASPPSRKERRLSSSSTCRLHPKLRTYCGVAANRCFVPCVDGSPHTRGKTRLGARRVDFVPGKIQAEASLGRGSGSRSLNWRELYVNNIYIFEFGTMPKPRSRVCLQDGLKLDLNRLRRRGFVRPGARAGPQYIQWNRDGEIIATRSITANMEGDFEGWFDLRGGNGLICEPNRGISAVGNGTSSVHVRTGPSPSFGSRPVPGSSPAGNSGAGGSAMPPSLKPHPIVPGAARPRSRLGSLLI